ncbi:splicing factor 3A subunit 2-like isoform X7 [Agelaius tricolor]|uniref:splicing factor 3A subunit 2-like isoform X7 n=1 Tax=Agelaius tricolor TaxID=9191 RepID=UPI0039F260B0
MNPPYPGPSPPSQGIPSPPAPGHPSPPSQGIPSPPAPGHPSPLSPGHPHLPRGIHPHLPGASIPTFPGHPHLPRGIHPHLPWPSPPSRGIHPPPAPGHPHLPRGIHPHLSGPSHPHLPQGIHPHLPRAVLTCPGPFTPTCPGLFSPVGAVPGGIGALSSPGQVESSRPAAPQCFLVPLPVVPGEAAAEPGARGGAGVPGASRSCPISIPSFAPLARQLREPAGSRNLVLIWRGFFCKKHAKKKERQQKLPGEGGAGPGPPSPPRLSLSISIFAFVYFYIGNFKHLYFNNPVKHYELPRTPPPPSPKSTKDWDKNQEVS